MNDNSKMGDCYIANGQEFMEIVNDNADNVKLVHGVVKNSLDGLEMGHCWIEKTVVGNLGGKYEFTYVVCIDKSNGNNIELPKEVYYFYGKIDENKVVKYNKEEYYSKLLETQNWGPWDIDVDR